MCLLGRRPRKGDERISWGFLWEGGGRLTRRACAKGLLILEVGRREEEGGSMFLWGRGGSPKEVGARAGRALWRSY